MLLDGVVYSRKRRDTFNEHALHQTVAPPSRDPEELPLTPAVLAEVETSGLGQRSVRLHEEEPSGKVVHDPEHVDGRSPVRGAIDRSIGAAEDVEDAPPESPESTAPSRATPLVVNVSSTATNYPYDRSTHTTVAVDHLASSSSVSVGSGNSLALTSARQSPYNETSGVTPRPPQDTSSKYTLKTPDVGTRHREVHVASEAPIAKLSRNDSADFDSRDNADNAGTSESSNVAESSGNATMSASGAESAKLGADSTDYGQVVGGTAENGRNVFLVDYIDNIDNSTVEPTTVTEIHSKELAEDQQSNVSNSDSSETLVPVEMDQKEVDAITVSPSMSVVNEPALDTLSSKDGNVGKSVEGIIEVAEDRDDVSEEKISSGENKRLVASAKSDGVSKTANAKSVKSQTSGIVKETRELSRELSSSESGAPSNTTSEQSEELQRDYPVPIYSYAQDEVEIVNLRHKKRPVETAKAERPAKSPESASLNNDAKTPVALRERDKDDLRVIVREKSDEEFLRRFKERFHEASTEDKSIENSPSIKTNYNSPPADTLHETVHDSSGDASPRSPWSEGPMTQRVQVVEVPVYRDDHSQPSSPSSSSSSPSSHRVLINVTIAAEDPSAVSSRPLYVLSVSVPMESGAISHSSENNVDRVQVRTAERLSEPSAASMKKIPANDEESINVVDMRLPPPPQPPASPPAPIWAGGECECSCPCMGSSSDEWDNFSAIDDDLEQELESINSTLLAENSPEEPGERLTGERDGESSVKDSVRPDAISTTENYYPSSIDDTVESGESTNETSASTYEPEVSTDVWSCSGNTPLPPEPTILILEGEASFFPYL